MRWVLDSTGVLGRTAGVANSTVGMDSNLSVWTTLWLAGRPGTSVAQACRGSPLVGSLDRCSGVLGKSFGTLQY